MYVGCRAGCPGLVGRRLSSASVVRLKCYRSHVVYERRLCAVPARLKSDLLHARPVDSVKARHFSGGFGNRSRWDYTVGACMMHRRTYCIVCTATLAVLSSRIGILKYVYKPKVGDKDELELSETVPRAPPSTKVQAKKEQDAEEAGELSGNGVEHLKGNRGGNK